VLKVGLTGGIAVGKSVVGEMFSALGAHVIQADKISHQLMEPGEAVYDEVVRHFGSGILDPDGRVNRARLAEAVFGASDKSSSSGHSSAENAATNDLSRVHELNKIVHPAVIRRQEEWMEKIGKGDPHAIAIVEAALILEAGMVESLDRLVVVTCSPEQRIERLAGRLKIDQETARREVGRRMAAQISDEEKIKAADYLIDNSGSLEETRRQVEQVYAELKRQA
jgi:dephospho-CoA kinase